MVWFKFVVVLLLLVSVLAVDLQHTTSFDREVHFSARRSSKSDDWEPFQWTSWMSGPACPRRAGRVLVPLSPASLTGPLASISHILDSLIANVSARYGIDFGAHIGIVYGDQVLLTHGTGTIKAAVTETPTADTIFSMGSVSKIFTSHLLMALVDQGVVSSVDQPVTDFFNTQNPPAFTPLNPYGDKSLKGLSLRALASHTSGLAREPVCNVFDMCQSSNIENLIIQTINSVPLFYPPLTVPHYSNLAIGLLSRCLERAMSKKIGSTVKFEDLMEWKILQPLGMNNSGFHYTDSVKAKMAVGYTISGGFQVIESTWAKDLGWATGCGGLHTTTNDMLKFLASLRANKGVLSHSSLQLYASPSAENLDGLSGFGLATWEKVYANGYQVLTKGGLVGGFGTSLVFVPELELGLVSWTNLQSGSIPSEVTAKAFNVLVPALEAALAAAQPKPKLPDNYTVVLGVYGVSSPLVVVKEVSPGVLQGSFLNYPVVWTWEEAVQTPTTWLFRYRLNIPSGQQASCFTVNSLGEDAVALFSFTAKGILVSLPDQAIWNLPKLK